MDKLKRVFFKETNTQKGFALLTTYMLMTVVSVGAMASFTRAYIYTHEAARQKNSLIALEMVESAVDKAIVQLEANSAYAGTGGYTDFSSPHALGGYATTVAIPAGAPSNIRQITATGYAPNNITTTQGYKNANVSAYIQLSSQNYFTRAAFAASNINISGSPTIDSYNSTAGAYNAATASGNGDVGTNGTSAGSVNLSGNATVRGDVVVGSGGNPSTVVVNSGSATITGTASAQTTNLALAAPAAPSASLGNLTVSSGVLNLAPGVYVYTNIRVTGGGKIQTTGAVTIYATGTIELGGNGVVGSSAVPGNIKIYATSSNAINVGGSASMYAALYAPLSTVTLGGTGDIHGAVVGNVVNITGDGNIHYDEALASMTSDIYAANLLTWIQSGNNSWTD